MSGEAMQEGRAAAGGPPVHLDHEDAPARGTGPALVLSAVLVGALLVPLLLVLDRIGVPGTVLLGFAAGTAAAMLLVAGASGGTMRLPLFLTGGRDLRSLALGLAFGVSLPVAAPGQALATALPLGLFVAFGAPVLLRSGAVSLPTFLAARYGGRSLRALSALLVVGAGPVLAAHELGRAATALAAAFPLSPRAALDVCAVLAVVVLSAAGIRGLSRSLVLGGTLVALAAIAALAVAGLPGPEGKAPLLGLAGGYPGLSQTLAVVAALLAQPSLALVTTSGGQARSFPEAGVWAACLVLLLAVAAPVAAASPSPFAAVASSVLGLAGSFACALALVAATGMALGYDLPGRRNRLAVSTSRRFFQARLAMVAAGLVSAWLAASHGTEVAASWTGLAEAALVAGVLPPLLLTFLRPTAGAGAGASALVAGLAGAALAYDPRVWPGGAAPVTFAVAGLAAGLAVGFAVSLGVPAARPIPPRGDAAL